MHKPDAPLATTPEMIEVFEAAQTDAYRSIKALDEQRMYEKKRMFAERYGRKLDWSESYLPFDARTADGVLLDYKTSRQDGMGQVYSYMYGGRSWGKSVWQEHATREIEAQTGRRTKLLSAKSFAGERPCYRVTLPLTYDPEVGALYDPDQLAWLGQYGRPATTLSYVYKTLQTILRSPERPVYHFCDAPYAVNDRIRQLFEGLRAETPPINYDAFMKRYARSTDGLYPHQRDFTAAIKDKVFRVKRGMGKVDQ